MTKPKTHKDKPTKDTAKVGKDTIYVDVDDEITAIIDKVEAAKQKVAALVLPKRSTALQSIVNMRLLKRSAGNSGKSVVLITSEKALLPLAGAVGLHVAKNLQSKPEVPPSPLAQEDAPATEDEGLDEESDVSSTKLDYHRSIGELAATHALDEPEATIPLDTEEEAAEAAKDASAAKAAKNKKLKVPNFDRFRLLLVLGAVGLVALITFLILALVVLPKAKITIQTSSVPLSANFNLTTSDKATSLDEAKKIIPSILKTAEQSANQKVQATGQQNLGEKAKGSIKVSNCTNNPVTIPAGNGVSSGGLTFITQKSLSLDSGNFDSSGNCKSSGSHVGNTDITAQQPGTKYNLSAGQTFSVSGHGSGVSGSNGSALTGGTDNIVTIVSQQDVDKAKQKITSEESDAFSKTFQKQLGDEGQYVLASTLKLGDPVVTASPGVGQQASSSDVTIKISYSVLVVPKTELAKAVTNELNKQLDKNKQKLTEEDVLTDVTVTVQEQKSPTLATLSVSKDTQAVPIIDINEVKKQVGGKKEGQIRSSLEAIPGVQKITVKYSPFWVSKAPKKPGKITVELQPVKDSKSGD